MLDDGEKIGDGEDPQVDVAGDPIDRTKVLSKGLPNAVSVVAMAPGRGSLYDAKHVHYMHKIATGAEAAGTLNIDDPVAVNLQRVARAKRMRVSNLTVVILDRPRHEALIKEVRDTGARIKLISDGDVAGAVMTAIDGTRVGLLVGVGGVAGAGAARPPGERLGGGGPREAHWRK